MDPDETVINDPVQPEPEGTTPPKVEPEPQSELEVAHIQDDPLIGDMMKDLLGEKDPNQDFKPADEGDETPAADPEPPAVKPDDDGLKVLSSRKSIQQQIQEELAKQQTQTPAAPATPPPAVETPAYPVTPSTPESLDGLSDEEQDYHELLQYAVKSDKAKYQGAMDKFVAFTKERNKLRDRILTDNPNEDLEDNETLTRFTNRSRPTLPRREIREIERMHITSEVEKQVRQKYDAKLEKLDEDSRQSKLEPVIEKQSSEFSAGLLAASQDATTFGGDTTIPDIIAAMQKDGVAAVQESNPLFSEIVSSSIQHHTTAAKEYVKLVKFGEQGMNAYNDSNPIHRWLVDFINDQDAQFLASSTPKKVRTNNGVSQNFATQQAWGQMKPEEQARHWTFSTDERLKIIQANAIITMNRSVNDLRGKLKKEGWSKKEIDAQLSSQVQKSDNEPSSPKVKQSIAPGSAHTAQVDTTDQVIPKGEWDSFGLPGR